MRSVWSSLLNDCGWVHVFLYWALYWAQILHVYIQTAPGQMFVLRI